MDSYRMGTVDVPEVRNRSSCVTPCIVTKNDGVRYHHVSSFSPERWTKCGGSRRQRLPSDLEVQHVALLPPSVSYATMNVTFTAHSVGRTFFGRGEPGCFHSFDWCFKFGSFEQAQVSSIATIRPQKLSPCLWYRYNKACATV